MMLDESLMNYGEQLEAALDNNVEKDILSQAPTIRPQGDSQISTFHPSDSGEKKFLYHTFFLDLQSWLPSLAP